MKVFQQSFAIVTVDTSSHSRLSTQLIGPKLMTSFAKKDKEKLTKFTAYSTYTKQIHPDSPT